MISFSSIRFEALSDRLMALESKAGITLSPEDLSVGKVAVIS
jgi:hypothetical protein